LFPPKKKRSFEIRVIHSFILVNILIIKLVYPIYNLKEVLNTLVKPVFIIFFLVNTTHKY
jgi:hypothetical protein